MDWAMMAKGEAAMRVERLQCTCGACAAGARHGRQLYHGLPSPYLKAKNCCAAIKLLPNEAPSTALIGIFRKTYRGDRQC